MGSLGTTAEGGESVSGMEIGSTTWAMGTCGCCLSPLTLLLISLGAVNDATASCSPLLGSSESGIPRGLKIGCIRCSRNGSWSRIDRSMSSINSIDGTLLDTVTPKFLLRTIEWIQSTPEAKFVNALRIVILIGEYWTYNKTWNTAVQALNYRIVSSFMSEKIGGVEGTKLNEEYTEMERKTDLTVELVDELISKTKEYLQPNPATRSKMMMNAKVGQNTRARNYAQPEGILGETILRIAHRFGEDSPYVRSLMETGEAFKQMAEIKYALEDDIKQDFLEPLVLLQSKDLRDVVHHRKKLESRRLDFDCKKRRRAKGASIPDEEIKMAEDKFEESFNLASQGMHNLLQNDVEQISQLSALVESLRDYHKQCGTIFESLSEKLSGLREESAERQHSDYVPKKLKELNLNSGIDASDETNPHADTNNTNHGTLLGTLNSYFSDIIAMRTLSNDISADKNYDVTTSLGNDEAQKSFGFCVALYDFAAESPGELSFTEGQVIKLYKQIDENWFEGSIATPQGNQEGIFPVQYVQVTQPIPDHNENSSKDS
ncbi:Endophilin-A [Fragariocoptes setiger]|uniref:Endophilin-A n=1 Tax=Fragariocoptes setiger TaxID=1670756 RepID=A0ABQ7S593_9ACAR|nr:Endophilin-A [Fragariocoptes setiger]